MRAFVNKVPSPPHPASLCFAGWVPSSPVSRARTKPDRISNRKRRDMDHDPPKTVDWPAIRAAYEAGAETVRIIAALHGVSKGMIDRRRVKEDWPRRSDTGRIAPRPRPPRKPTTSIGRRCGMIMNRAKTPWRKSPCAMAAAGPAFTCKRTWNIGKSAARPIPRPMARAGMPPQRLKAGLAQKLGYFQPGWALLKK